MALQLPVDRQRQRAGGVAQAALAAVPLVAMQHHRQQDGEEQQRHDGTDRQREQMRTQLEDDSGSDDGLPYAPGSTGATGNRRHTAPVQTLQPRVAPTRT